VNVMILCVILKQLRHPSYDISPKAAIEKRGTRYGLRTNSLMLLGLCLGWIFAVLSFRNGNNMRYQLTFGLVNGLQGIFLFFFHCLLNSDHVKGYISGSKGASEAENGRSSNDSTRSKRQDSQTSSKRKAANRTSKLENVPLISVSNSRKSEEKPEVQTDQVQDDPQLVQRENVQRAEADNVQTIHQQTPDPDIIPQLPGTPDPHIEHHESFSKTMLKIETNRDLKGHSRSRRPKTADNQLQIYEDEKDFEKRRKSSSEPAISSGQLDSPKERERADRLPAKQTKKQRPHVSLNELESLFSRTDCFTKPHCSSLSSLPRRERRISYE
ncbi:hypothetical protein QZH41_014963, partial [Actinostola sp. cb2023]